MSKRRVKAEPRRKRTRPPVSKVPTVEIVIPPPRQSLEALQEDCGPGREPSPEELSALEVTAQREQRREKLLGLAREYPRTDRPLVKPLTDALKALPGVRATQARVAAQCIKQLADKAHDLDEIAERILQQERDPGKVAELVMAFQLVSEQLASYADVVGEKLYDVFDQAKGLK